MNLQQIQALTNEQKTKYMAMGKLFDHPSYKYLLDWAQASVNEAQGRELNATTWELVLLNRGARLAFTDLVNLETQVENEFAQLAEQAIQENAELELEKQNSLDEV
jgi:hypothetical protein